MILELEEVWENNHSLAMCGWRISVKLDGTIEIAIKMWGFPNDAVVKEPVCQCWRFKKRGLIPGSGR